MATAQLSIITPSGKSFEGAIQSVIAPGEQGFLEVLAYHAPLVTKLKKGIVTLTQDTQKKYFAVGAGVLEVNEEHNILLLCDFAVLAASQNEAQDKLLAAHA